MIIEYVNVGAILAVALIDANASIDFDYLIGPGQDVFGQPRGLPVTC